MIAQGATPLMVGNSYRGWLRGILEALLTYSDDKTV